MATPGPGWYEDPAGGGGQRYWDGGRWTGQVRPGAASQAPPSWPGGPAVPAPGAEPQRAGGGRRTGFLIAGGVGLLVLVLALGAVALTGGSDSDGAGELPPMAEEGSAPTGGEVGSDGQADLEDAPDGLTDDAEQAAPSVPFAESGEVTLLHAFTGAADVAGLTAIIDAFNEEYPDIEIIEEGSNDFESLARTRVGAGNSPDVILHPQPGLLQEFWAQGVVTPLDDVLDVDTLAVETVAGLPDLVTFDGLLYAVPMRLSLKSLVWYNPQTFEAGGYEVPETWAEMMELTEAMAADDIVDAPWCIGIESGDATGWIATDWVEDILLRTIGPDGYDAWVAGDLSFSSSQVKGAIESYLVPIWTNDDYVFGGQEQIARESFGTSVDGILGDPAAGVECGLHRQATFIESFIAQNAPDAEFGTDYDFFYLPPISRDGFEGRPVLGAGDFAALYSDNPAANTFMRFLAAPEAGEGWAALGGYLSPFAPVFDNSIYPSDSARTASDILAEADAFRFDGSDTMPGDVGSSSQSGSFWIEMTDWIQGNQSLDEALADIDALYAEVAR